MNLAKDLFFTHQALAMLLSVTNKLQMQGDKYLQDLTIRQVLAIPATIHAPESEGAFRLCSERTDDFLADIFHDFTTEDLETLWTLFNKLYRFDGVAQESSHEYLTNHTGDDMLQHHHSYTKRRTDNDA